MGVVNTVHFAWRGAPWKGFRRGVSIHSHTSHSQETLDFIPRMAKPIPLLRSLIRRQEQRFRRLKGREFNYLDAWWTPPLGPREALRVERGQVDALGLRPLVSLSDHNNIEAPLLLRMLPEGLETPISVEWTVPYHGTFFHVGVHNLPERSATERMAAMAEYTASHRDTELEPLLEWLSEDPGTLVVLNHPHWDEKQIGQAFHDRRLHAFLRRLRMHVHGLEINGIRSWSENRRTIDLASSEGLPVVGGGDRHGCEPNAIINLSNAESFPEFVAETRAGHCGVLLMPQYREPRICRVMRSLSDVMRDNHEHTHGWVRWTDRVFFRRPSGVVEPVSSVWGERESPPMFIRAFACVASLLDDRRVQTAVRHFAPVSEEVS